MASPTRRVPVKGRSYGALRSHDDPGTRPPAPRVESAQPAGTADTVRYVTPDPSQYSLPVVEAGTGGKPARKLSWLTPGSPSRKVIVRGAVLTGGVAVGAAGGYGLTRGLSGGGDSSGGGTPAGGGNPNDDAKEDVSSNLGLLLAGIPIGFGAGLFKGLGFNEQDAKSFGTLFIIGLIIFLFIMMTRK